MLSSNCFVAVHGGAGYHNPKSDKKTKEALRLACKKALEQIQFRPKENDSNNKNGALDMVEEAIISLEDESSLNAGLGSNLTLDGTVECDAAIMTAESNGLFGSIGAVSGVKNPIRLARGVLEYSMKGDGMGRIPPMTLVSQGAVNFITRECPKIQDTIVPPESLITSNATRTWDKWKARMEGDTTKEAETFTETVSDEDNVLQDTVGAVSCYHGRGLAAGVSSGGLLLKFPGRIGEAAVYGAGCWAQSFTENDDVEGAVSGIACSISGTGEQIVYANLARSICETAQRQSEADPHEVLRKILADKFWKPAKERSDDNPAAGVLMMTTEPKAAGQVTIRVWCAFTTPSMAIAFASLQDPKPKAYILRRPEEHDSGSREPHVYITAFRL